MSKTESTQSGVASASLQTVNFLNLSSVVPATWQVRPLSSNMRVAQYETPGDKPVEMVVFYFGSGQGGSAKANIARWVNQFRPVDGKPAQAKVSSLKTNRGFDVTWTEIQGDYARGVGMGPVGDYKPDQMLIAAITQTPHGALYIQFHGDKGKVLEHRDEFSQFVMSLQARPAP